MYCNDADKTLFVISALASAGTVFLEGFNDHQKFRVRMSRKAAGWSARLNILPGWFFYRFEVDGRPKWDRDVGKCKSWDGRPCSLAIIQAKPNRE